MSITDRDSHLAGPSTISLERCRSTFAEPTDPCSCRRKPRISLLQIIDRTAIAFPPQSLWREAPIMPIDRQATSEPDRVVPQLIEYFLCLAGGQSKVIWIEQRGIHRMQRKFEESLCRQWSIDLRCARTIAHRFVVANRRIVARASLFQASG